LTKSVSTEKGRKRRYSRLNKAAALSLLRGTIDVRLGTVVRVLVYAAIPVIPAMVELAGWDKWQKAFFLPYRFHLIYWWAILVVVILFFENWEKGKRAVQWQAYWTERGRIIAGVLDEVGQYLTHQPADGRRPSIDRIGAGVLQQIVTVVRDLTRPDEGVHIMACILIPEEKVIDGGKQPVGLQASVYNEAAGRHKSWISLSKPGPAQEAYETGRPAVVADTSAEPYREQFEGKPYRSVMAFPVNVGQKSGRKIAIVTVDATQANTFTPETLEQHGIEAAIFPYLKMIGLLRVAEQRGGRRGRK
jgi:hypothetical protein